MSDFVHMESAGTCEGRVKCRNYNGIGRVSKLEILG